MAQAHLAPDQKLTTMIFLGEVARAWLGGSVEVSDTREGEDGFVYGAFEDGTTFTTEVPNGFGVCQT